MRIHNFTNSEDPDEMLQDAAFQRYMYISTLFAKKQYNLYRKHTTIFRNYDW